MHLKRKLPWILTGKALIATGSIAMVALALVTYTATVTITFSPFFVLGTTTSAWSTTTSSGTRYLPGNTANTTQPGCSTATTSTFSFCTKTGQGYVQVGLASPVSTNDFQSFRIFVLVWNTTGPSINTWTNATLYTTSTFGSVLSGGIDGTTGATAGFLRIHAGQTSNFEIQVNYVLVGTPADPSLTATFDYTPSLA